MKKKHVSLYFHIYFLNLMPKITFKVRCSLQYSTYSNGLPSFLHTLLSFSALFFSSENKNLNKKSDNFFVLRLIFFFLWKLITQRRFLSTGCASLRNSLWKSPVPSFFLWYSLICNFTQVFTSLVLYGLTVFTTFYGGHCFLFA